jgi:hypothetical protein
MLKKVKAALALAAFGSIAGTADAAVYSVSYGINGSSYVGTWTTTDTANAGGFYTVTSMSGTQGGFGATLLGAGVFAGNDNLVKLTVSNFTINGVSYSANGVNYNIYSLSNGTLSGCVSEACVLPITNFSIQLATAAVPEPATWAMMMLGFGAMGAALRSRRKATVAFA